MLNVGCCKPIRYDSIRIERTSVDRVDKRIQSLPATEDFIFCLPSLCIPSPFTASTISQESNIGNTMMKFFHRKEGDKFFAMNRSFDSNKNPKSRGSEDPTSAAMNAPTLEMVMSETFDEEVEAAPVVEVTKSATIESIVVDDGDDLAEKGVELSFENPSRWAACRRPAARRLPSALKGWTRRERVLLVIAVVNTILIFILLGSNLAVSNKKNKGSVAASSLGEIPLGCGSSATAAPGTSASSPSANSTASGGGYVYPANAKSTNITVAANNNDTIADNNVTISVDNNNITISGNNITISVNNKTISNSNNSAVNDPTAKKIIGDPNSLCGCAACTQAIWSQGAGEFSCGDRITYLASTFPLHYPTQVHACRQIAFEFPCACGGCDPARCSLPTPAFNLPSGWKPPTTGSSGAAVTPAPTPVTAVTDPSARQEDKKLYCFPDAGARKQHTLWGGMVVQVKESTGVCGPGDNKFTTDTVVADTSADTLTLRYANGVASEVRVLLPESRRPFTYGTYRFSIGSVEVKDAAGVVLSNVLPKELVLGLFSWDDTEVRNKEQLALSHRNLSLTFGCIFFCAELCESREL